MSDRRNWLESRHLRESEVGARAVADAAHLDSFTHDRILAFCDDLAADSVALSHAYFPAAVRTATVAPHVLIEWEGHARVLLETPEAGRDALLAFLALDAADYDAAGAEGRAAWIDAAVDLCARSRRLGALFLDHTSTLLTVDAAPTRLKAWGEAAARALETTRWRGEWVASALLESAPLLGAVLSPQAVAEWSDTLAAIAGSARTARLPIVPGELAGLDERSAEAVIRLVRSAAVQAPAGAATLLSRLTHAVAALPPAAASSLTTALAGVITDEKIADALALVASVTHGASDDDVEFLLATFAKVAEEFPAGAAAFLTTMGRAFEEGGREGVAMWAEKAVELGVENAHAGIGHLYLQTRTAHKILRERTPSVDFSEVEGLMQRFLVMMSRRSFQLVPVPGVWFRPPLSAPEDTSLRLPERIDVCDSAEDNQLLYKLTLAHIAGRYEYGTYDFNAARLVDEGLIDADHERESDDVVGLIASLPNPLLGASLFVLLDGIRVDACLEREFAGLARDFDRIGRFYASHPPPAAADRPAEQMLEALFMLSVGRLSPDTLEPRLRKAGRALAPAIARLRSTDTDVYDSARYLLRFYGALTLGQLRAADDLDGDTLPDLAFEIGGATVIDPFEHLDSGPSTPAPSAAGESGVSKDIDADLSEQELKLALDGANDEATGGGVPLTPEEIKALIDAGMKLQISSERSAGGEQSLGLYITDLLGKLPAAALKELREAIEAGDASGAATFLIDRAADKYHRYDEWDHRIGDYRREWCKVAEHEVGGDTGQYYQDVLARSGDLLAGLKREFQRLKPEQYRKVRGMEHGEEFDLAALVDAHADRRSRRPPTERLYVARRREERDIATLLLVDMSASTDEPLPDSAQDAHGERRVIEVLKDTLVVMSDVTEDIGDAYAVYGFSGHGREGVEYFHLKSFSERLNAKVKARLGGLAPKRSTRMGAALRHSAAKLARVNARSKYLLLLSDGFPQDFDYGDDRRSNVYGIQDTMKALQELEAQGVRTFCITVDPAGHDYLGEMCAESRYAVISDVASLPEQLPRIYQSLTRS